MGHVAKTTDVLFKEGEVITNADKTKSLSYTIGDSSGKALLTHTFTLPADGTDGYMIDFNIGMANPNLVAQNTINLLWQTEIPQVEKTITYEKTQTHIAYLDNGKYDFKQLGSGGNETFDKPVDWVAINPQFFVATLLAKDKMQGVAINWVAPADSLKIITQATVTGRLAVPANGTAAMQIYYGPNDYNILDKYNNNMHQITTYGSGPFSFVKYINRHFYCRYGIL